MRELTKNIIRIPTHRAPTHPGEMLLEEFLIPMGLTQRELARAIYVSYRRINQLVNKHKKMTPGLALRLAKYFGVSANFWMSLQLRWDLYHAQQSEVKDLERIQPHTLKVNGDGLWSI
jgi:addiction module HigA family antidote